MRRLDIFGISSLLVGILAIAAFLFFFQPSDEAQPPSFDSYRTNGGAAFASLLEKAGLEVETGSVATAKPGDLIIAYCYAGDADGAQRGGPDNQGAPVFFNGNASQGTTWGRSTLPGLSGRQGKSFTDTGANIILLEYSDRYEADVYPQESAPVSAARTTVRDAMTGKNYVLQVPRLPLNGSIGIGWAYPMLLNDPPAKINGKSWNLSAWATTVGARNREKLLIIDAYLASNQGLAAEQNASFMLDAVRWICPTGRVYLAGNSSNSSGEPPSFLTALGAWAELAWMQILFCGLIVAYTLGSRFGLAERPATRQLASREFADAFASVLRRSGGIDEAFELYLNSCDRIIRREYRIAQTADRSRRNDRLPPELAEALLAAERSLRAGLSDKQVVAAASRLDQVMKQSFGRRGKIRPAKA